MKDHKKKCVNVRDLILTFGDEHPLHDRCEWKQQGCPIDYWKWVSVKLKESEQAVVPVSSDTRTEKEKLFFFEIKVGRCAAAFSPCTMEGFQPMDS